MFRHPFRKAFGLTFLYGFIIIGIFILQFRSESVILKNAGLLRISVSQTQDADGNMSLKNTVGVSFKGISFTADDVHPAVLLNSKTQNQTPLTLISWEQPSPQSFKFNFTENTALTFTVSDTSPRASLSIAAQLPDSDSSLSLYYNPVSGYSVTEQSHSKQLFSSKNISYTMSANQIKDTQIILTKNANVAMYTRLDPTKAFTFASIPTDSQTATAAAYETTISDFRNTLVSQANSAFSDSSTISETVVAAFVAEMASQSRYQEAIKAVPDSFKNGARRTYFTSPYFNTLVAMNPSLVMANENFASMIQNAIEHNSIDVFSADNIADYMLRNEKLENVKLLAALPATIQDFQPTLVQATSILQVYLSLKKADSPLAEAFQPVTEQCLNSITQACTLSVSDDTLTLHDRDFAAGFVQTVETGTVLINYGKLFAVPEYCAGGYMLINTAFAQNKAADLRTLAELYPVLTKNNTNYPHSLVMDKNSNETVWAWTCASNITYEENENSSEALITVSFKQGDSHYIIINGIKPFVGIEIYGLSFHTDPRFETYNSSGYIYNEKTHTLFLKSRHKVSNEKIRLYFSTVRNE